MTSSKTTLNTIGRYSKGKTNDHYELGLKTTCDWVSLKRSSRMAEYLSYQNSDLTDFAFDLFWKITVQFLYSDLKITCRLQNLTFSWRLVQKWQCLHFKDFTVHCTWLTRSRPICLIWNNATICRPSYLAVYSAVVYELHLTLTKCKWWFIVSFVFQRT